MKNNILASIALFGQYRNQNFDTYDVVVQYISAAIVKKGYTTFTPATMKEDLFELFQVDLPVGVIKSVCKNRMKDLSLSNGVFKCSVVPPNDIDKEYEDLNNKYDNLYKALIDFVRTTGHLDNKVYKDEEIKNRFADFIVDSYTSESSLNNIFAAFINEKGKETEIGKQIDLLSAGLISYNGLRYEEDTTSNGAWTDKLTIYLDTEFLFSCAGYNGDYYKQVFKDFYDLINEVNNSFRRRRRNNDDLIQLKYLKDTRDVYLAFINSAKNIILTKTAPDPSKRALVKIVQESQSQFDVDVHKSQIDTVIVNNYHIIYDDNDYINITTDPRYVIFDENVVTEINSKCNPKNNETIKRKIDYFSRVLTIINGLRRGEPVQVFEKSQFVFLTGSRIGRQASISAINGAKTVTLATDIDFVVSRLWFKLNKPIANNRIPASLNIVTRSQAALSREVTKKVQDLYEELQKKNLSDSEKKTLYANLKEKNEYLEPYDSASIEDVLNFIEYTNLDELIEAQRTINKKAEEFEEISRENILLKKSLAKKDEEFAALNSKIDDIINSNTKTVNDNIARERKLVKINTMLIFIVIMTLVAAVLIILLK